MATRTITVRGATYPLILPSVRDPRLHVAAVILTVHALGQIGLGFRISVPQILAAILTCAILEVAITFRQAKAFVWPASAMLTGSGVALILRVVGTPAGDHWTFDFWWLYAIVAGLSLLSKYVIRYRGVQVFNPSNIGLVVAFVVLGTTRVEPLDFWWAPLNVWMLAAYAVILVGGTLITRRLHLLVLAAAFWLTLATGLGVLAASGHCMTASWAFSPVCGFDFWRVVVASPEVMIFLFFMITDPRTVPTGAVGRAVFGVLVGVTSTLLLAPQTDEFGTKVALLSGLVVVCAARPLLDRLVPAPGSPGDGLRAVARQLAASGRPAVALIRVGVTVVAVLALGVGIVTAGTPARGVVVSDPSEVLGRVPADVDVSTLPPITVGQDVLDYDHTLAGEEMRQIVVTLAQNLELENQALVQGDETILSVVDHGDRLIEMQDRLHAAATSGTFTIAHYRFDSIFVRLLVPFGRQTGLSIGLESRGSVTQETYDHSGALQSRSTEPFALTFAVRRALGDRWLDVAVLPISPG
jgi:hypothetical protein